MPEAEKTLAKDVGDINYDKIYQHMRIRIDGKEFYRCEFYNCVMVYGGGELPAFAHCRFTDTIFEFVGASRNTVLLMRAMYQGMGESGQTLIEETFNIIRGIEPSEELSERKEEPS
jgi:hypothetical protein